MKLKNLPLIYLEWCDATSKIQAWNTYEEAIEWAESEHWAMKCVGWVIKETKKYLLLCQQISPDDEYSEEQYGGLYKIPKTWIIKKEMLEIK